MNREYHVRDILAMSKDEVWTLPDGGLWLTFDNGERLALHTRKTIECSYYWKMFREWPGAQILPKHHYGLKPYTAGSHVKTSSIIFWDTFFGHHKNYMVGEGQQSIWEMSRRIFQISNELYNDCICMLGEYVTGLDIEDIVEILDHPEVIEAKEGFRLGDYTAEEHHDKIYNVVTTDPILTKTNNVSKGMASDTLNRRQATQVVGGRASVPDSNGEACKTMIHVGYGDGLHTLYDRFRESRTASIALYMATGPLEKAEYNNRMCQFLCGIINDVYYGDCGGSITIPWDVMSTDLKYLVGKYHMVEGKPVMIHGDESDLIGTTIQVRSITTCTHSDPTSPCSVCVGFNAVTTPPGTNLGHHLSTEPLARISQTILSTKHVLASTKSLHLEISERNKDYFILDEDNKFKVKFTKRIKEGNFSIRIPIESALCINDVLSTEDVFSLNPNRISNVSEMKVIEYDKMGGIKNVIDASVRVGDSGSPLTLEFLEHMRTTGWEVHGQEFEVTLKDWNHDSAFVLTPRCGENIMDILETTSAFLSSPNTPGSVRAVDFKTPGPAIRGLLDVMTSKIHVNFTHVEVFVRALMASGETSYALPKGGEEFRFIRLKEAIQKRGMGAALAFERHRDLIFDPSTYMRHEDDIPGHRLDWLVK